MRLGTRHGRVAGLVRDGRQRSWHHGHLSGPAQGGTFTRGHFLPDGGIQPQITMTVSASQSLNHIDIVEQETTLDGGPLPVYYRFDRQ